MRDVFLYGTLRHKPLLQTVLGSDGASIASERAKLVDHVVFQIGQNPFPHVAQADGYIAEGLLLRDVSEDQFDRLKFYESAFEYSPSQVEILLVDGSQIRAEMFRPDVFEMPTTVLWDFESWITDWAEISENAALEAMSWLGQKNGREMSAAFAGMRRRASAKVSAERRGATEARELAQDVVLSSHEHAYANFFSLQDIKLQVRQFDGGMSPILDRAVFFVGEAAVVLPYDPATDRVMLIEQFRAPVFMAGDIEPWVWEPVAGLLEPGESAEKAARRETLEETGLVLEELEKAGEMYSSTGSSTEYLYLFVALVKLDKVTEGIGGTDEGEDIRSRVLSFDDLMEGVDQGRYKDMPLVTLALWLSRHRERLRKMG